MRGFSMSLTPLVAPSYIERRLKSLSPVAWQIDEAIPFLYLTPEIGLLCSVVCPNTPSSQHLSPNCFFFSFLKYLAHKEGGGCLASNIRISSLLSVLLSVLLPVAPLNVHFSFSPSFSSCFSQMLLEGIALGQSVSLPPLSALTTPLMQCPYLKSCWIKLTLCCPLALLAMLQHKLCQSSLSHVDKRPELSANKATEEGTHVLLMHKCQLLLRASSECGCHFHLNSE